MKVSAATALLTVLVLTSCGEPRSTIPPGPEGQPGSPSPAVTIHAAPAGTPEDPLSGLPETVSKAILLVSTTSAVRALEVIDLSADRSIGISDVPGGGRQLGAFTAEGRVVFAAGPRAIGFIDPSGAGQTAGAELPATVPGSITSLSVIDGGVAVSTRINEQGRERDGRTVLLGEDGNVRCEGPEGTVFPWFRAGWLWSADLRNRLDIGTCAPSTGLALRGYEGPLFFLIDGSSGYVSAEGNTLSRFALDTGTAAATSPSQSEPIDDVVMYHDDVWVLAGAELVRLDRTSLEVKSSKRLPECAYDPSFVKRINELYVLDDCEGVLYRLGTGASLAEGWSLPLEEGSDIQVYGVGTDEGIWLVDEEQTGEPYFFNAERQQLERIPVELRDDSNIFALVFDVHPKPKREG